MAAIFKHPKSPFLICQFRDASGKRVTRSTKQTGEKAARKVAEKWEAAALKARSHELTQAASVKILNELMEATMGESLNRESISEAFTSYVESRRALQCRESTLKRYEPVIKSLLTHLGPERSSASIASLTTGELEKWHAAESAKGKGGSTADYGIKVISAALARQKRLGYILHNPAGAVELTKSAGQARQPLTDEEIAKLLAKANKEWKGMILLAAWCGLRLADAAGLTWGNVDLEKKTLTFQPSKTRKTDAEPLVVALHSDVTAALKKLPRGIANAPLFASLHGRKPGSHGGLSNEFARLMKAAGIDRKRGNETEGKGRRTNAKSFHSLRHSMISRMANAQVSADVRKAIAGHSSDEIHRRYTHLSLDAQRRGIGALPSLVG
jgi:integrase